MPLYEYQCQSCAERVEVIQRVSDPPYSHCPKCGGEMKKLMSAPAIQFKGSGFYKTDYVNKPSQPESKSDTKSESKSDSNTQSKSESTSESKSESKSDTKTPVSSGGSADS